MMFANSTSKIQNITFCQAISMAATNFTSLTRNNWFEIHFILFVNTKLGNKFEYSALFAFCLFFLFTQKSSFPEMTIFCLDGISDFMMECLYNTENKCLLFQEILNFLQYFVVV